MIPKGTRTIVHRTFGLGSYLNMDMGITSPGFSRQALEWRQPTPRSLGYQAAGMAGSVESWDFGLVFTSWLELVGAGWPRWSRFDKLIH